MDANQNGEVLVMIAIAVGLIYIYRLAGLILGLKWLARHWDDVMLMSWMIFREPVLAGLQLGVVWSWVYTLLAVPGLVCMIILWQQTRAASVKKG